MCHFPFRVSVAEHGATTGQHIPASPSLKVAPAQGSDIKLKAVPAQGRIRPAQLGIEESRPPFRPLKGPTLRI